MFLISQSLIDLLSAVFLVATASVIPFRVTQGHFGVLGKSEEIGHPFLFERNVYLADQYMEFLFEDTFEPQVIHKCNELLCPTGSSMLKIWRKSSTFVSLSPSCLEYPSGILRCYLWEGKHQLWTFLICSTYNLVGLNIERWISIKFPGEHCLKFYFQHIKIV